MLKLIPSSVRIQGKLNRGNLSHGETTNLILLGKAPPHFRKYFMNFTHLRSEVESFYNNKMIKALFFLNEQHFLCTIGWVAMKKKTNDVRMTWIVQTNKKENNCC